MVLYRKKIKFVVTRHILEITSFEICLILPWADFEKFRKKNFCESLNPIENLILRGVFEVKFFDWRPLKSTFSGLKVTHPKYRKMKHSLSLSFVYKQIEFFMVVVHGPTNRWRDLSFEVKPFFYFVSSFFIWSPIAPKMPIQGHTALKVTTKSLFVC